MRKHRFVPIVLVLLIAAPTAALAATEKLHREHVFTARPGATVKIDVSFHEVEVSARPGDTISVTVDLEGTVETSSGGIHSDFPGLWEDRGGHHLVLQGGPEASKLTVDTSSGGVRLIAE
jgi:hypothetical protein